MANFKQEKSYYCGPASLHILQTLLGYNKVLSQDEWAVLAKTTSKGTGIPGLKRCIMLMASGFDIIRKTISIPKDRFAIIYDHTRDHWMVVEFDSDVVYLYDPEYDMADCLTWKVFQSKYLNSQKNSYGLVING